MGHYSEHIYLAFLRVILIVYMTLSALPVAQPSRDSRALAYQIGLTTFLVAANAIL